MIIECKNLSKVFEKQTYSSKGRKLKTKDKERFWALNHVSFSVKEGETFSIIGANGSGKSTLLKIICGITPASSGSVEVKGSISALLELGVGFHYELSGWENIFLYGSILGISREDIQKQIPAIVEFSGISHFLDTPIKHYSSGMLARLAFSTAININPDILIIDEILSVGDIEFQSRSLDKIKDFKAKGKTILLVTHEIAIARQLSDRIMWLDEGEVKEIGDPTDIAKKYHALFYSKALGKHPFFVPAAIESQSQNEKSKNLITITSLSESNKPLDINPMDNNPIPLFKTGEKISLKISINSPSPIPKSYINLIITKDPAWIVSEINSSEQNFFIPQNMQNISVVLTFNPLMLVRGRFHLSVGLIDTVDQKKVHLFANNIFTFDVITDNFRYDFFMIKHSAKWEIKDV